MQSPDLLSGGPVLVSGLDQVSGVRSQSYDMFGEFGDLPKCEMQIVVETAETVAEFRPKQMQTLLRIDADVPVTWRNVPPAQFLSFYRRGLNERGKENQAVFLDQTSHGFASQRGGWRML